MEKERLQIQKGIKEIEVNDKGECIYIPTNDNSFYHRFCSFLNWIEQKQKELEKEERKAVKATPEADEPDIDEIRDGLTMQIKICDEICSELDKLFGEGCCRKVFAGVESPDILLICDFLEQISPILQKLFEERGKRLISKYNRNRKGAKSMK